MTNIDCLICMDEIKSDIKFLPCAHSFHTQCINRWIHENPICPECRIPINITTPEQLNMYNFRRNSENNNPPIINRIAFRGLSFGPRIINVAEQGSISDQPVISENRPVDRPVDRPSLFVGLLAFCADICEVYELYHQNHITHIYPDNTNTCPENTLNNTNIK